MSVTANQVHGAVQTLTQSSDTLFLLLGAIMVFLMHAGFAFLEVGTVRQKNQVNALVKILADFGISAIAYFFIGYWVAYGGTFFADAETLSQGNGYELVKFFFLADLRCSDSRYCFRWYRRTSSFLSDFNRNIFHCRYCIPTI